MPALQSKMRKMVLTTVLFFTVLSGFPLLMLNIITPQVISSVRPSEGEISDTSWNRSLNYDQDFEITRPWYYFW